MAHVRIDELPGKTIAPGIMLRSVHLERLMVTFVTLGEGAVLPLHAHPHEQITVVIAGALKFTLEGEDHTLRAGDAITIPPGAKHAAAALDGPCTVYDSWSPVRDDYILSDRHTQQGLTESCEVADSNPPDPELAAILKTAKTVAVVGLSDNPERDSFKVARYLKEHGYRVIPINPARKEILGERSYPDLASVPEKIDVVDIFRQVDAIPGIVDEAIKINAGAVWMQLGLAHRESAEKAKAAGLKAVQGRCMKIEYGKLIEHAGGDCAPSGR
ncbi:MAG: cupin domain-containing protein [Spirochaetes bacterium]|nr:MAG: cupin domain-containing protein [Spirochaetota bacterium]